MKIYAIKDTKIGFQPPFLQSNDSAALRDFKHAVNSDVATPISKNYEDMELYCLGDYDLDTGIIDFESSFIVKGVDVRIVKE